MSPSTHLVPDAVEFRVVATRLAHGAQAVRSEAGRLQARVAATHWYSPAAAVFRETTARSTGDLRAAADRLDEAAWALQVLAGRLEAALDTPGRAGTPGAGR